MKMQKKMGGPGPAKYQIQRAEAHQQYSWYSFSFYLTLLSLNVFFDFDVLWFHVIVTCHYHHGNYIARGHHHLFRIHYLVLRISPASRHHLHIHHRH